MPAAAAAAGAGEVQQLPRRMRSLDHRLQTPNADREPIRYQWHTRPFKSQIGLSEVDQQKQLLQHSKRLDSDDILQAVRNRIRSPPDANIRNRMQHMPPKEEEVNSVLAHYLAGSSLADSVLNYRLQHQQQQQQQQPGCSCCAEVNFVNKSRRHLAARGTVSLNEQLPAASSSSSSSFYYHQSPDQEEEEEDHRAANSWRRRQHKQLEPLRTGESEERLRASMRRLQQTIQSLEEPTELPVQPVQCTVRHELQSDASYYRPGEIPTKYLAFAPKNPLRHQPPSLDSESYRSRRQPGRMKYVSFSPRSPQLRLYSPDAGDVQPPA